MAKEWKKYLVDATGVKPPLPPNAPLYYERRAFSESQACWLVADSLRTKLRRFVNPRQLMAQEDTTADAVMPPPRMRRQPDEQDHSCHPHLLQLPLFEGTQR